jgi:phosphoglycerate kinase
MAKDFLTLDTVELAGKTVLLRADLNVPMQGGRVTDSTRIVRLLPTLHHLLAHKAKIVILSHFGRPKGKFVPDLSLAPLVDALSAALDGKEVHFGVDCVGPAAQEAVSKLQAGEIVLLENLRFHPEEEAGDANFARELASLGDVFINDAFSASHRAHASITGIADYLPTAAGRLMEEELSVIVDIFEGAQSPVAAVVGGAKVSTKLALLQNLSSQMDVLVIGGAMANTFLYAQGHDVGASLFEKDLKKTALDILKNAEKNNCKIVLPVDVIVAEEFKPHASCTVRSASDIPKGGMAVDVGPQSVALFAQALEHCKLVIWNGPLGAFETSPFDVSTVNLARTIASLSTQGKMRSIAGGGDTLAALNHAGLASSFSYLTTGGGAFLEWLEGKPMPGITALAQAKAKAELMSKPVGELRPVQGKLGA